MKVRYMVLTFVSFVMQIRLLKQAQGKIQAGAKVREVMSFKSIPNTLGLGPCPLLGNDPPPRTMKKHPFNDGFYGILICPIVIKE